MSFETRASAATNGGSEPPREREALQPLLIRMPRRGRVILEVLFVVTIIFLPDTLKALVIGLSGGQLEGGLLAAQALAYTLLAAWGLSLVARREGATWTSVLLRSSVLLLALATAAFAEREVEESQDRQARIGVGVKDGPAGEPGALVEHVVAGAPADGQLERGDLILALGGERLARDSPAQDLIQRAPDLPVGKVAVEVIRKGRRLSTHLELGPVVTTAYPFWMHALMSAALAVLIAVLVRSDGQSLRQLGLARQGALHELSLGAPVLLALLVAHVLAALPIAGVAHLLGADNESAERAQTLSGLVTGVDAAELAVALVVAATFEEIAFRGFLLPRLRVVLGGWGPALFASAAIFAVGHLYEGTLGAVQAGLLGVFFGLAFLWRGRLEAPIVAHACFNAIMFALVVWLTQGGWLERLSGTQPP